MNYMSECLNGMRVFWCFTLFYVPHTHAKKLRMLFRHVMLLTQKKGNERSAAAYLKLQKANT